jgi:hypothetical protein
MSGFLNQVKQSLSNPKQEFDETSKAILDIENKKKAFSQAAMNEQNAIKSKISDVYVKIGETAYGLYIEGNFEVDKITGMFETIKNHFQTLDENKAKLDEILGRYNEELKILRPSPLAGQAVCSSCGTAYVVDETAFCSGCGNKVAQVDTAVSESAHQSSCPNCDAVLIPGSVFCAGCGNKV